MKKIMKLFVCVAAAAMALASCQKNEIDSPVNEGVKFTINAGITETKTVITDNGNGTYTPSWDGTEELAVLFDLPNKDTKDSHAKKFTNETGEGATAKFSATVEDVDENGTLYAVYPYAAFGRGFDGGIARLDLKNEQKPTATSFDPSCDILVAKPYDYAVVDGAVEVDPLYFTRVMSVLKVNLLSDVESIQNDYVETIKFSTGGIYITGYAKVSVENPEFVGEWTTEYDYVTASYDSESVSVNGTNKSVYFVVAPVTIPVEKELTFTIKTSKYTITKTIKANEHPEMEFSAGNVSVINLNIKEEDIPTSGGNDSEKYYEKVTSEPDDWSGKYLIVYEETPAYLDGSLVPGKSSGQIGSTAGMIGTTISNDRIASSADVDKSIVIIEKSGDGYALKASSGTYMGMSGNDNGMKSSETASTYVHTITFNVDNSVSLLSSDGYTKLAYNKSSNYFRYYKVTTISGQPASYPLPILYRLVDGNEGGSETPEPEQPKTLVSISVDGQTTTYTVGDTFEFDGTVTATYDDESTADVTASATFTGYDMDAVGTHTVTVSYTEGEVTQTATYSITVNEAPAEPVVATIAEFLAAEVNTTVMYKLTGKISDIANEEYGNFTLTDNTVSVYIYGLTKTQQSSNDKSFASLELKVGDVVTLVTVRGEHQGTAQGGGKDTPAYYVSHVAAPTLEVSPANITVEADVTTAVFELSCDTGYDITYPEGVVQVSEVHSNETGSSTYTVSFPVNETAEPIIYVITVKADAEGFDVEKTVTITQKAASQGGGDEAEQRTITFDYKGVATDSGYTGETIDGVTLSGSNIATNKAGQLRVYANTGTFTLDAGSEKITKIELTFSGSSNTGTFNTAGYSDGVWTGSQSKVTFKNSGAQARITKIVVTVN